MLDNMTPDEVRDCVAIVRGGGAASPLVEVSGGITLENVAAYAAAGADLISDELDHAVGARTRHRPRPGTRVTPPMLLCIDTGNTQTVIGLFDGAELADHWRIASVVERTADELALMIQQFLGFHGFSFDAQITGVAIASGVPRVTAALREMTERYFGFPRWCVEPGVRTGMPILYDNPKEVGADRIANAVAAYDLYGGPSIVVDFGTANTIEAISEKGEYLGGAIFPGIEISMDALFGRAAALRRVELVPPKHVIGKSTVESIQSGCVFGFSGQVDALVDRFRAELGRVHRPRHGWPRRADPRVLPDDPALRALAHAAGPADHLREEQVSERERRLRKVEELREAGRTRTPCASTGRTPRLSCTSTGEPSTRVPRRPTSSGPRGVSCCCAARAS